MASPSPRNEETRSEEQTPLLSAPDNIPTNDTNDVSQDNEQENEGPKSSSLYRRLYISHFLSTWNSRVFEFGSVLYLATVYPGTLLPMSIYAFVRGLSAIVLAPAIGRYIDTGGRMQVVRVSIVGQRLVVAISCAMFYVAMRIRLDQESKNAVLGIVTFLACIEKVCSILNMVSIEKDWVVVVASGNQPLLRTLNAQMRRIDLICKLIGPLFIALLDGYSTQVAILVNLGMNLASVMIEYVAIAQVYRRVPDLQQPKKNEQKKKKKKNSVSFEEEEEAPLQRQDDTPPRSSVVSKMNPTSLVRTALRDFKQYILHPAFGPSFSCALLYLTVLSFSGQMVTYLLTAGYDSTQIGIARTVSVAFEILATWVAPWLIGRIGPVKAGFWMANWQVSMLVAGVAVFWTFGAAGRGGGGGERIVSATGLVGGTILSRVGLRGFDLCAQIIVQNDVEADFRGTFSSVEAGWQSAFELLAYASTMIFSRPEQFKWPVLISVIAVAFAGGMYTARVYIPRSFGSGAK